MKKYVRPSRWIACITMAWGLTATFSGLTQSYAGLIVCRLLLGLTEAGLFPGMVVYLTFWYTKRELALRTAFLFVSAAIAGSVGGLLAYGIGFMDGLAGYSGWRCESSTYSRWHRRLTHSRDLHHRRHTHDHSSRRLLVLPRRRRTYCLLLEPRGAKPGSCSTCRSNRSLGDIRLGRLSESTDGLEDIFVRSDAVLQCVHVVQLQHLLADHHPTDLA